jgi:hypothetical protein
MRSHSTATRPGTPRAARQPITRDRQGLLDALAVIDAEGWDGPTAAALLFYVREQLIRPLAIDVGLRGAAESQAEATAWGAVWLQLCDPRLRSTASPWGVVWQTARRALLGEILAGRWGADPRRAWEYDADERAGTCRRPVSLETLVELRCEPAVEPWPATTPTESRVSNALDCAAAALVGAGWHTDTARQIVAEIAAMDDGLGHDATVVASTRTHALPSPTRRSRSTDRRMGHPQELAS